MSKKFIYLDHAATTPLDPRVKKAMEPYLEEQYGNPSTLYNLGREAKIAIDDAREKVADIFNCRYGEIAFTGGGTASDNLAIFGVARKHRDKGKHLIISQIEHHAVLRAAEALEKEGFEITYLPVDEYGMVNPEEVKKAIRPDTILVSIMYANNEIGTIEPIAEIGKQILKYRRENSAPFPYFHSDACQAAGALDLDVKKPHVDLMTINGSKIYGPKGVGVLYMRKGVVLSPLIYGGGQEFGLRSGTENVAGIVGLARALELAQANKEKENKRLSELRDYLWQGIKERVNKVKLNGDPEKRLPNNLNITILDIEGEALLLNMDEQGVAISTGSACTSTTLDPSHVITALGLPYEYAHGSIRFSLGGSNTKKDIDYVLEILPPIVERLREISPTNLDFELNKKHPQIKKI